MFNVPVRFRIYDKLKLYSDFIEKGNIWEGKLWDECQVVLAWSATPAHKHIGTYLNAARICEIFGIYMGTFSAITVESDKTKKEVLDRLERQATNGYWKNEYRKIIEGIEEKDFNEKKIKEEIIKHAVKKCEIPDVFTPEYKRKIITKIVHEKLGSVGHVIKSIHTMGFGDLNEKSESSEVRINRTGFLMGELILELTKKKNAYLKYVWFKWLMISFLVLLFFYSFVYVIRYLAEWIYFAV